MTKNNNVPDKVDLHVGMAVRTQRLHKDMSQGELGIAVGVTFQQIQKYERGTNRISASMLFKIATVLGIRIENLFPEQHV